MEKILSDIVDFKTKSKQIAIDSKTPITASSIDNELWIKLLDNIIETFSRQHSDSSIPFFQQSPSHVLIAQGIDPKLAVGSIRISLSLENTEDDIKYLVENLESVVSELSVYAKS